MPVKGNIIGIVGACVAGGVVVLLLLGLVCLLHKRKLQQKKQFKHIMWHVSPALLVYPKKNFSLAIAVLWKRFQFNKDLVFVNFTSCNFLIPDSSCPGNGEDRSSFSGGV